MEYFGVVYGSDPKDSFYKLSRDDLASMKLVGLPVKLEHSDKVVGKITHSKLLDNGTLMIKYTLNKNVSGFLVDQLIHDGHLTELSLSHIDTGKEKIPTEVSVVFKGARPETKIFKRGDLDSNKSNRYINEYGVTANFVKASNMSSVERQEPIDSVRAADPMPVEDEPAAKRSKMSEPVVQGTTPAVEPMAEPAAAGPEDRLSMLEKIVSSIPDQEGQKKLYDMTSEMMSELIKYQGMCHEKDQAINSLQAIKESSEANTEANARAIAGIFSELVQLYNPNYQKNEALSDEFVKVMQNNPQVLEFVRPIEVCASNIKAQREQLNNSRMQDELISARERVKSLQQQLGAYSRMTGHSTEPVHAPAPTPVQPPAAAPAPVPAPVQAYSAQQNPAALWTSMQPAPVAVEASAVNTQKASGVELPSILRQHLNSYNNGAYGSNRVMPSDFSRPIISKQSSGH